MSFLNNIVFIGCGAKGYILRIKYYRKAAHLGIVSEVVEKKKPGRPGCECRLSYLLAALGK